MSTIDICGRDVSFRALTRKEVKALKKEGLNLNRLENESVDDVLDRVFDTVLPPDDQAYVEDSPAWAAYKVWRAVMAATFGDPDAEKNLPGSGNGDPTEPA